MDSVAGVVLEIVEVEGGFVPASATGLGTADVSHTSQRDMPGSPNGNESLVEVRAHAEVPVGEREH